MAGNEIFAIFFMALLFLVLLPLAALDMLGEKGRAALWTELSEKLTKIFKKRKKEHNG